MGHAGTRNARAQSALTLATLVAAMLFGGGQGTLGDTLAQLLAIALLGSIAWRADRDVPTLPWWTWLPVLALVAIPALQFLPLPAGLWQAPPARAELAAQLDVAGVATPGLWTLHPLATARSLLWLLPGIAIYLSVLRLPASRQAPLWRAFLALVAVGALLGLAQRAQGPTSPLLFYSNTNPGSAVGLFANRNHFATLLALALPLAIAWFASPRRPGGRDSGFARLRPFVGAGLCLLLLLALALSLSRAGIALGMLALAIMLPLLWTLRPGRAGGRAGMGVVPAAMLLASAVLLVQFALFAMLQKYGDDALGDDRLVIARNTAAAAADYSPLGSGLGTFRQAYAPYDVLEARAAANTIVNHAHNDVVELWLELGWLMVPAALLFLGVLVFAGSRALRRATAAPDRLVVVALCVAIAVPLLHSLVDYPLRTSAHLAVAGWLLGMLVARSLARAPVVEARAADGPGPTGPSPAAAGIGYTGT